MLSQKVRGVETPELEFRFFRDSGGRLRAHLFINGTKVATKPVERASDKKRYNIGKVFSSYLPGVRELSPDAYLALVSAKEGDVVRCTIRGSYLVLLR